MSAKENVQVLKRWFKEVWNEGRTQTIHELLSPDAVARGQRGPREEIHGPDEFLHFVQEIRSAFPNIHITLDDAFGSRDKVVGRWSGTMTHTGQGFGEPTGKQVALSGITIARVSNGQIVEGWDHWDRLGMLEQIGAYKQPATSGLAKSA